MEHENKHYVTVFLGCVVCDEEAVPKVSSYLHFCSFCFDYYALVPVCVGFAPG